MTLSDAIQALRPGAEWVLHGADYSGLVWLDNSQSQPTQQEVNSWLNGEGLKQALIREFSSAAQGKIDATAKLRQYADGVACASYANSKNLSWKADAETFIAWRDAVWSYAFTQLAAVEGGAPQPTVEAFVASLPQITWPS